MSEMVESEARIFRFGDFPGKGVGGTAWGITREEFVAANGETGTIPVGLDPIHLKHYEGKTSVLDGRTGTATFSVEGDEVRARFRLPAWLDEVRRVVGLKVSSVIGRLGKELRKVDLVDTPHIPDAVFFAGEHGDVVLFEGDEPAEAEAVTFADDEDFLQHHHEVIAGAADSCGLDFCSHGGNDGRAEEDPKIHAMARALRVAHDHCVQARGDCCPGMGHHHGEVGMSDENEVEEVENETGETVEFAEETPREKSLRERVERLEAEAVAKDAVTFADSVTRGRDARALPAERRSIVEGYTRSASIDRRLGDTVTFTADDGKAAQGSHLDAFKASFKVRPRIAVRDESVVGFAHDLPAEPDAKAKDDEAAAEKRRKANQEYAKSL